MRKHDIGCLIVSPTRELAIQISGVVAEFIADAPNITQMLAIGGSNVEEDIKKVNGTPILMSSCAVDNYFLCPV